jgi:hypothetical protein
MRQIVLIPVVDLDASNMYNEILSGGVNLLDLESSLFVKLHELLLQHHGNRRLPIWGLPSGNRSVEANKWNRTKEGDVVLFYKEESLVASAVIKVKFQSENIARLLWPEQVIDEPRQYLFTMDDFMLLNPSQSSLLGAILRKAKLKNLGFQILDNQVALEFLQELGYPNSTEKDSNSRASFGLSAAENKVIEKHAVALAIEYLSSLGYGKIQDVGDSESFDLIAETSLRTLKVEVKGSTGPANNVILTKNEVFLQKNSFPDNGLLIVSNIELTNSDSLSASGGEIRFISPWNIDDSALTPISYDYKV